MQYLAGLLIIVSAAVTVFILRSMRAPSRLRKAEEFLQAGDFSKSNALIKPLLDKNRDFVPARYMKARILMEQKQYLMAISELNNILNISGFQKHVKEVEIHYKLAHLYHETKNYTKEIEEYRIILTFNPDDVKANHRLGHAMYRQGHFRQVKEHLTKALVFDPNLTDTYLPLGVACYNLSDYGKAEEYLTKSLEIAGDPSEAEFYLGSILKLKKDNEGALAMLEKSRQNRAFFIQSLHLIGQIFFEEGDYEKAISYLEQGLNRLKERTQEAHEYRYLLAECYELQNKIKEAVYHWEKIAQENQNFRSTKLKLDQYREILQNENLMELFSRSIEDLQPIINEVINTLHYNIISREKLSPNEYEYRAYNIKRMNDPPILIRFNRTTREITEGQIIEFQKHLTKEKSKSGVYITTSKFSLRAKSSAGSKMIEIYGSDYITRIIQKLNAKSK